MLFSVFCFENETGSVMAVLSEGLGSLLTKAF